MMKKIFLVFAAAGIVVSACLGAAQAEVRSGAVEYKDGAVVLEGYLSYDDSFAGKRPGVLIVHEWTGLGDYVKSRAAQLARMGYVAFAADIYGKGVRPKDRKEAANVSSAYRNDRPLLRRRAQAALKALRVQKSVDPRRIAAIGYCFGGTAVLELARSGADVKGVVSFHGGLNTPDPQDAKKIRARVLVLHGADDPNVPPEEVAAFQEEMRKAKADWQFVSYGGAVHSFTNPDSGSDPKAGAAYDKKADERSWRAMKVFFDEIFQE